MFKRWSIAENRHIKIRKSASDDDYQITIFEDTSVKQIVLTGSRWSQLTSAVQTIDEKLEKMSTDYVKYQHHLGGGYYVSVTTGFRCVDLRQFYGREGVGPCATRKGIALRLPEWTRLKEVLPEINKAFPELENIEPCLFRSDHYNQEVCCSTVICLIFRLGL